MNKPGVSASRRAFLTTLTGTGAALMLSPLASFAADPLDQLDPRVAGIVAGSIGIDSHNHIDVAVMTADVPGPKIDLAGELKHSGLAAVCMTFALDYQKLTNPGEAYERFKNALDSTDVQLKNNGMKRALTLGDLNAAHDAKQPTAIQSVEGCHFLEGRPERLAEAYGRGLRHLGLLHDSDASVPLGDVYTNPPRFGGLTAFGTEVIKEANRLGMLVDLAHADAKTTPDALKIATHPVIVSHTGLDTQLGQDPNMARMMKPRLISKDQAKMVADAGGVIGVWTHLAGSPLEYAKNIRALVDVIGVDHVCIGTDTKLTPGNRPGHPQAGKQGEGPGGQRPGERTNDAWGSMPGGFYFTVVDALLKTGFMPEEIIKIGGGNYCRLFDAATAGH